MPLHRWCIAFCWPGYSIVLRDAFGETRRGDFPRESGHGQEQFAHYGGGGAPTTIVRWVPEFSIAPALSRSLSYWPSFHLITGEQHARFALHNTCKACWRHKWQNRPPGAEVSRLTASRVPFYPGTPAQYRVVSEWRVRMASCELRSSNCTALHAHSRTSGGGGCEDTLERSIPGRSSGQCLAPHSHAFKELLGQTPLAYVTEWRMQKRCSFYTTCQEAHILTLVVG